MVPNSGLTRFQKIIRREMMVPKFYKNVTKKSIFGVPKKQKPQKKTKISYAKKQIINNFTLTV